MRLLSRRKLRFTGKNLVAALVSLLIAGNRLPVLAYRLLFGVPRVLTAFRRDGDRAFQLWTLYALSFTTFVLLRRGADALLPARWEYVIGFERLLFLGEVPTLYLQRLFYTYQQPDWLDYFSIGVHLSYYAITPAIGVLLWLTRSSRFAQYMVCMSVLYFVSVGIHTALPTVPPWLAAQQHHLPRVYHIVADVYGSVSPSFYRYGQMVAGSNDVAAMPSLHTAAVWVAFLAVCQFGRAARFLGFANALAMVFSLVYLGEHYVADALAGIALASLCWGVAGRATAASPNRSARLSRRTARPVPVGGDG